MIGIPTGKGAPPMTLSQPYEHAWRARAAFLSTKLDRAHSCVYFLGDALEKGDSRAARGPWHSARRAVDSVAREVNTLRDEQPATVEEEEPAVTGSALTIDGADAATMALDVMVNSMVALSATTDDEATDVLIGDCVDAARVYEGSAAVVKASLHSHGSETLDLKRAYEADGEVALRNSVVGARARLGDEVNEQAESSIEIRRPLWQLDVGAAVEVRNRFVGMWCHGFEVADQVDGGYVIRRVSDRAMLPEVITQDEVRSDRRI
jgi:hypothetical protein